ncbi:MAG: hypothetical protein AAGN66_22220 [Acidobacteriota bacterium]
MRRSTQIAIFLILGLAAATANAATLQVNNTAALGGTGGTACSGGPCGLEVAFQGDTDRAFLQDDSPNAEEIYRFAFRIDTTNLTMVQGTTRHVVGWVRDASNRAFMRLELLQANNKSRIMFKCRNNGNNWQVMNSNGKWFIFDNDDTRFMFEMQAGSAPGAGDGLCRGTKFAADGVTPNFVSERTGLNNSTNSVDHIRVGAVKDVDATTTGSHYFDEFESYRTLAP